MVAKADKLLAIQDAIAPTGESHAPDYLAWRDAKVKRALADADAEPEEGITLAEAWKKFGLDP